MKLQKRAVYIFALFVALAMGLMMRVYVLTQDDTLRAAAQNQSTYLLHVDDSRGMIYDCNFYPLVNNQTSLQAAVVPTLEATQALMQLTQASKRASLLEQLQTLKPFLLPVASQDVYAKGIRVLETRQRYSSNMLASHVIGYVNADGDGVYGIEKACDELLKSYSGSLSVRCTVDAWGNAMSDSAIEVVDEDYLSQGGVQLTIDREIQRIAENACRDMEKGAVVVLDCQTGQIKAMVSRPTFDPLNLAQSLNDPDSPFVNRAISAYNVGSVYKMVVCAAALKSGIGPDFTYTCVGAIDVGGQVFYCHDHAGHGELTMKEALEESCNPYFIKLGLEVGGDAILAMAEQMGFGQADVLYTGYQTASGSLPQSEDLQLNAALANFSFGQGDLTATPLQIAKYLTVFANHGKMVVPQLVLGQVDENGKLVEKQESYMPRPVVDSWIADTIANYMVTAVEEGSGKRAKPEYFGAGGKTGSAQTGIYNEDGEEIVHAWFGGFFPVEQPQYVCVVLVEGGDSGALVAAPIFKEIADAIAKNAMG